MYKITMWSNCDQSSIPKWVFVYQEQSSMVYEDEYFDFLTRIDFKLGSESSIYS